MRRYLQILQLNLVNSFRSETAFVFNNWGNMVSTTIYTLTFILFFEVIYANIDRFAGYTKNEMLFFVFVTQISFYILTGICALNVTQLIADVNAGSFDLVLVKPLPSLFYTMTRKLRIFSTFRDSFFPLILTLLFIDLGSLNLQLTNILSGFVIFALGIVAVYAFYMISALPVFWLGESRGLYDIALFLSFDLADDVPFEGFKIIEGLQFALTFIVPLLVPTGLVHSVILGRFDPMLGILIGVIVAVMFMLILVLLWQKALNNYQSASS